MTQQTSDGLDTYNAELHLAEGDNRIELVAYNQDNTIQSRSNAVHVTVESEELDKPRLYILAMGIDDYAQESFALRYAVNDATALADNVARAGNGLYSEIFTHMLTDDEVTRENLEQTFASLARTIRPNDVFVFFSAGHGVTQTRFVVMRAHGPTPNAG